VAQLARAVKDSSKDPTENASSIFTLFIVMGRARPGHPRLSCLIAAKTWMPGTRPGMTVTV